MRIVAGGGLRAADADRAACSSPCALTGKVPQSCTPGTKERPCSTTALRGEPRVAAVQAAEARAARQRRVGLERRGDHLAVEVDERVERRDERAPGPAAEPRRRADPREARRRHRRGARAGRGSRCMGPRPGRRRTRVRAFAAQPVRSLPITEWPVKGTTSSWASGISAATRARVRGGRAQILGAGEDQRRDVRERPGRRWRGDAYGQAAHGSTRLERSAVRRVEGREVAGRLGVQVGKRFREPRRRGRAALPRERRLLAGRGDEQRFVGFFVAHRPSRCAGTFGISPSDRACRRSSGSGSSAQRGADRCRQQRAQGGVQVSRLEDVEQAALAQLGRRGGGRAPS